MTLRSIGNNRNQEVFEENEGEKRRFVYKNRYGVYSEEELDELDGKIKILSYIDEECEENYISNTGVPLYMGSNKRVTDEGISAHFGDHISSGMKS